MEGLKEIAKAYNEYVKTNGKQTQEEKKEWFKKYPGMSLRTFQHKVKTRGLPIKADRSTGLYEIEDNTEPIPGQLQITDNEPQTDSLEGENSTENKAEGVEVGQEPKEPKGPNVAPGEKVRTAVYIDKQILKDIKVHAIENDTTFSEIVRELLEQYHQENIGGGKNEK